MAEEAGIPPQEEEYYKLNEDLPNNVVEHKKYKIIDLINNKDCLPETYTESSRNNIELLNKMSQNTFYGNKILLGNKCTFYNGYLSYDVFFNDDIKVIHDIKYVEFDGKPITNTWFSVYVYKS